MWRVFRSLLPALLLGLAVSTGDEVRGQAKTTQPDKRVAAAKCISDTASFLRREAPGKPLQVVKQNEDLYSGDLIIGGGDAAFDSANGAVRLSLVGDLDEQSPFPIVETAVILHPAKDVDLDFTLERGRVDLINRKTKGPARVRVHNSGHAAEVILTEPGAHVALEVFGRWPAGVRFNKDPKPGEGPAIAVVALAIKGQIELKDQDDHVFLKAPPGQALLVVSDLKDGVPTPQFLKELPPWAIPSDKSERAKKIKELRAQFRKAVQTKSIGDILDEMVQSKDEGTRRAAVHWMGALDELERLGNALTTAKHPDIWDASVLTLRHWIGRGPGQDQLLYKGLIEKRKLSPAKAEIVMNLLHSFGEDDLKHPETYETLIDYLASDELAIRGLANWHLYRLVPAGRKIGYDPLAPKAKRDAAVKEWRQLVPHGKLPPKAKPDGK
jgi:hypothetical protein